MKSIQSKIIILIIVGIVISAGVVGGTGIFSFDHTIDNDAVKILNLTCNEAANELNGSFGRIEQSVNIMAEYTQDNLAKIADLHNEEFINQYTSKLTRLGRTILDKTDGSVAIYVRLNPKYTNGTAGIFMQKDLDTGKVENLVPTDLSVYDKNDIEHVGWYYLPVKAGKAIWMEPYYNDNIDIYMISYVIPLFKDGELLGVVGMDINFEHITRDVDAISVYDSGYGYLIDDKFEIVHSKKYPVGTVIEPLRHHLDETGIITNADLQEIYDYSLDNEDRRLVVRKLDNNMYLAISVPAHAITQTRTDLIKTIALASILIVGVFAMGSAHLGKSVVKPIKELNEVAKKIAAGDLDVKLNPTTKDEVGTLTESLKKTVKELQTRIDYINDLAYEDKLTGVKNNTSYLLDVSGINEHTQINNVTIFVIDVNGLKAINDVHGHDMGNRLIIEACNMIVSTFGYEYVYRIGGDEFAVIINDLDDEKRQLLISNFEENMKKQTDDLIVKMAIGHAVYDSEKDANYEEAFKRADEDMYRNKSKMKERNEVSFLKS